MVAPSFSPSSSTAARIPWYRVWMQILTKPSPGTFSELVNLQKDGLRRPFLWVFLAGSFDYFVSRCMRILAESSQNGQVPLPGGTNLIPDMASVCIFPLGGAALLLGFMLMVAMMNAAARSLGGTGEYAQLAFASGALAAPFSIITALLLPLNLIPYVGLCFSLLTILIALYLIGLQVPAIMGVHQLGWGRALAAMILPALVLSPLAVCVVAAF